MRRPRVEVSMGQEFYDALCAFAASIHRTPANLMLHATATYMSKEHAWKARPRLTTDKEK